MMRFVTDAPAAPDPPGVTAHDEEPLLQHHGRLVLGLAATGVAVGVWAGTTRGASAFTQLVGFIGITSVSVGLPFYILEAARTRFADERPTLMSRAWRGVVTVLGAITLAAFITFFGLLVIGFVAGWWHPAPCDGCGGD
jgi:hypothetical protein